MAVKIRVQFPTFHERSGTIPVSREARSHRLVGRSAADPHTHAVECLRPLRWGMKQNTVSAQWPIAQLAERPAVTGVVAGSTPARSAKAQTRTMLRNISIPLGLRSIAQLVELPTLNRHVAGSIPAGPTSGRT